MWSNESLKQIRCVLLRQSKNDGSTKALSVLNHDTLTKTLAGSRTTRTSYWCWYSLLQLEQHPLKQPRILILPLAQPDRGKWGTSKHHLKWYFRWQTLTVSTSYCYSYITQTAVIYSTENSVVHLLRLETRLTSASESLLNFKVVRSGPFLGAGARVFF